MWHQSFSVHSLGFVSTSSMIKGCASDEYPNLFMVNLHGAHSVGRLRTKSSARDLKVNFSVSVPKTASYSVNGHGSQSNIRTRICVEFCTIPTYAWNLFSPGQKEKNCRGITHPNAWWFQKIFKFCLTFFSFINKEYYKTIWKNQPESNGPRFQNEYSFFLFTLTSFWLFLHNPLAKRLAKFISFPWHMLRFFLTSYPSNIYIYAYIYVLTESNL